jgi:[glutamine synthetase] adenylyltransferase / [glutamine synthetase]-adenylyl-L-tyrosine phosphorylase
MTSSLAAFFLEPESPPPAELKRLLKPFGFRNPAKVWREFSAIGKDPIDQPSWGEVLPLLLNEFSKAPDPDMAANHFATFAAAAFDQSQLFQYLLGKPEARRLLAQVMGLSPDLSSTLNQDPGLLYWLFDGDGLTSTYKPERLRETLARETAAAPDEEGKLNALARFKRRQMLRLGGRDLLGLTEVKELTFELSGMADIILEEVLEIGKERFGPPPGGSLAVMGMGKLGGQELNYSSDIDLLFVYGAPSFAKAAEGRPEEREKARVYFNDLAEWVIQTLTQVTPLGNLYRVDMRLRPEGLGDMAKSLELYLEHYETRGQPWELQALLKARPCAGDLELGRRFLKEVEPFIFRKNYDSIYLKEIREIMDLIKQKMESKGRLKTQVKLGRGGIREIEFIVQFLQLVEGGRKPQVRNANTLEALQILGAEAILFKADAQFLSEAYRFLRNVEHHLQMVHGLQTHTLPGKAADLERLARSLGFKGEGALSAARKFKNHYGNLTRRVRALYEEVFKIKGRRDAFSRMVEDSLDGDDEALEKRLEGSFFFDPHQAAVNLKALVGRLRRSAGNRGERLWAAFGPLLLKGLQKASHPDRALNQMESFLRATSLPDFYMKYLMEKPALLNLLLELFSNSLFLSQTLILQPGNFDIAVRAVGENSATSIQDYLDPLEDLLAETPDWEERLNRLRDTRNSEILRVGLQDLLGKRDLFESFAELSRLAQALSRAALGVATEQMKIPTTGTRPAIPKGFCLFAIGKLGGREMNYGSDLDVLFIYGDEEGKEVGFENYVKLAETFTQALASPTSHGMAYKIDARLRPMGREAMMVHSVEAYRRYFTAYGQAAERLAYTRAVFMAGDRQVGLKAKEVIEQYVYGRGLTRADLTSILDIRGQMEEKAQKAKGLELKVSPGGIVDVEFLVQTLQVAYGKDKPLLRMPHLPTVMGYLREEGILPKEAAQELLEAYRFYRLIEARHRMVRETADDELPTDPDRLARLAWRMGLGHAKPDVEKLLERIERTQERVRGYFNRLGEWVKFEEK